MMPDPQFLLPDRPLAAMTPRMFTPSQDSTQETEPFPTSEYAPTSIADWLFRTYALGQQVMPRHETGILFRQESPFRQQHPRVAGALEGALQGVAAFGGPYGEGVRNWIEGIRNARREQEHTVAATLQTGATLQDLFSKVRNAESEEADRGYRRRLMNYLGNRRNVPFEQRPRLTIELGNARGDHVILQEPTPLAAAPMRVYDPTSPSLSTYMPRGQVVGAPGPLPTPLAAPLAVPSATSPTGYGYVRGAQALGQPAAAPTFKERVLTPEEQRQSALTDMQLDRARLNLAIETVQQMRQAGADPRQARALLAAALSAGLRLADPVTKEFTDPADMQKMLWVYQQLMDLAQRETQKAKEPRGASGAPAPPQNPFNLPRR